MRPEKRNKILFVITLVVFLIALVVLWYFTAGPGRKLSIEIYVAPSDAAVTVDGESVGSGKLSLSPGSHTFAATRQYFEPITKEVDINNLGADKTVYLALYPNSPEGAAFLEANPDEQTRYERVEGAEFSALQNRLLRNYPVTTKLPYQTLDYKIDFDVINNRQSVVFLVTFYPPNATTPGTVLYKEFLLNAKADALEYLEGEGVDVQAAEIRYSPDPENL